MPASANLSNRVAACAGLMAFLYQLENCMTSTALPAMSRELAGLAGVISLVPAAYLVGATTAMVPAGRMAARVGFHRMLAAALAVMALGTVICALAPGVEVLIVGRWIEGLGGGTMASSAYGMVAVCVPAAQRRGALGWVSMGAGAGMVAGTPLGGLIAEMLSWRAMFGLQAPLLAGVALFMLRLDFGARSTDAVVLGWGRSLVLGCGAACMSVAGSLGRERGWMSPEILALQAAAILSFVAFTVSDQRAASPLFPLAVWRDRAFWPYWGLLFACAAAMGGSFFLLPFYLHDVMGMPVAVAAAWMLALVTGYSLAALGAGRLQGKLTAERQAFAGVTLTLAGTVFFALGGALATGLAGVAAGCALIGCGLGLAFPAVNAGCVARLPEPYRGLGAALLPLGLNLGSVAGVITTAEVREWHWNEQPALDYAQAFLVVIVALTVAGAGFWKLGRTKT